MEVKKLESQYSEFLNYIDTYLSDRAEPLKAMYDSFGNRLVLAPASSVEYYHNAFTGGYIDHVLRVIDFSLKLYEFYKQTNQDLSGFTKSNLVFVAMNHDLGKLGFVGEGREKYLPNDSEWHRKNMGKIKRKSLLTEEQQALLEKFQKPSEENEATPLSENSKTKATSAGFKPMVNRSGSRGK